VHEHIRGKVRFYYTIQQFMCECTNQMITKTIHAAKNDIKNKSPVLRNTPQ